ncbi:hypothetical protein EVAR_3256_1 [Eumeta japonica]|uniref:Uncharacterized protein n=1 Tax=Eumeta variegata TaxID=151549 RepID=A0A4C1SV06_EUMVA|nr:hypothetical protein EVAR_3256_1 [Eumeta japonica]
MFGYSCLLYFVEYRFPLRSLEGQIWIVRRVVDDVERAIPRGSLCNLRWVPLESISKNPLENFKKMVATVFSSKRSDDLAETHRPVLLQLNDERQPDKRHPNARTKAKQRMIKRRKHKTRNHDTSKSCCRRIAFRHFLLVKRRVVFMTESMSREFRTRERNEESKKFAGNNRATVQLAKHRRPRPAAERPRRRRYRESEREANQLSLLHSN